MQGTKKANGPLAKLQKAIAYARERMAIREQEKDEKIDLALARAECAGRQVL